MLLIVNDLLLNPCCSFSLCDIFCYHGNVFKFNKLLFSWIKLKFVVMKSFLIFCSQKAYVIHWVRTDRFSSAEDAYEDGKERLERLLSMVHNVDM